MGHPEKRSSEATSASREVLKIDLHKDKLMSSVGYVT